MKQVTTKARAFRVGRADRQTVTDSQWCRAADAGNQTGGEAQKSTLNYFAAPQFRVRECALRELASAGQTQYHSNVLSRKVVPYGKTRQDNKLR